MDFLSMFRKKKHIPAAKSQFEICKELCDTYGIETMNKYSNRDISEEVATLIMKTINEVKLDLANIKEITIVELHRMLKEYENIKIPNTIGKSTKAYDLLYAAKVAIQWELYHRVKL